MRSGVRVLIRNCSISLEKFCKTGFKLFYLIWLTFVVYFIIFGKVFHSNLSSDLCMILHFVVFSNIMKVRY